MNHFVFISYRRDDSSAHARSLRENLIQAFGDAVFMDVDDIRIGETWATTLDSALERAAALLVVIGPTWLRIPDAYGRRRLDRPDDWVRTEIERSFARGIPVIPVLVGGATVPPREGMPPSIVDLSGQQYVELRETNWKQDVAPLVDRLAAPPIEIERIGERVPVPRWPVGRLPDVLPRTLAAEEIQQCLEACPGWKVVTSPLPGEYPKARTELHRVFRFGSFDQALAFMQAAAPYINQTNHHPRWENVFKTVSVWLSTWDTGHVVSKLDFELALHLNGLWERLRS